MLFMMLIKQTSYCVLSAIVLMFITMMNVTIYLVSSRMFLKNARNTIMEYWGRVFY